LDYYIKTERAQQRGYSPAVITEGGRIVWLAGQTGTVDESGKSLAGDDRGSHAAQSVDCEAMRRHDRLGAPERRAGKHSECPVLLGAAAAFYRHRTPLRLSRADCSCQFGRASAPTIPHVVCATRTGIGTSSGHRRADDGLVVAQMAADGQRVNAGAVRHRSARNRLRLLHAGAVAAMDTLGNAYRPHLDCFRHWPVDRPLRARDPRRNLARVTRRRQQVHHQLHSGTDHYVRR